MTRVALAIALVVGCVPVPQTPARLAYPAARVDLEYRGDARCGAALIGPTLLVTAAHCVHGQHRYRRDGAAVSHGLDLIALNSADDVAWFRTRAPVDAWFRRRAAVDGEHVFALVRRDDQWVALAETSGVVGHFSHGVPIRHGDSGSPVVGADGAIVGIVVTCFVKTGVPGVCIGGGNWRPL